MNDVFSCSWVKNTETLLENLDLLNEDLASIVKHVKKKMEAANVGVPIRDVRLYFLQFFKDKHPDLIPDEFNQQFATRKPQAKDVNAMMGAIFLDEKTPKNFIDTLGKEFEEYSKQKIKLGDKEVDSVTYFLNQLAGGREFRGRETEEKKEKYGKTMADIEKSVKGDANASQSLTQGKNPLDTLIKNFGPETELKYQDELPQGNSLYTITKGPNKFRVTVRGHTGGTIKLNQLKPSDVLSLVVTEPKTKQTISGPGDIPIEREKPVADYPPYGENDWRGKELDPEDVAYGKDEGTDYDPRNLKPEELMDQDEIELSKCCHAPMQHGKCSQCGCDEEDEQLEMGDSEAHMAQQIEDEDEQHDMSSEEDCEYDARDKKRDGLAKEIDYDRMHDKSVSRANTTPDDLGAHTIIRKTEIIKKSPTQVDKELRHKFRESMQHKHKVERRYGLGY